MKAAVTGASGFVGSFLCEYLAGQGHDVTAMVRPTSNLRWLEKLEIGRVCADVLDIDSLADVFDGFEVVYHVAGLVRADSRADFMKVNFEGTRNLARACLEARKPPRRLVFVSSQAAAGPSPGPEGIDEDYPPAPVSAYGESKLAAEQFLGTISRPEIVTVRPSAVYGPRDFETLGFFKIVSKLRMRPLINGGRTLVSMVDVRDLVRGIALAGEVPGVVGRTYFVSSPAPCLIKDTMKEIARALGKRTVGVPVSRLLMSAGAEVSQFLAQFAKGSGDLSHLKVAELSQRYWVVKTDRARRELGFEAEVPASEGLGHAARWYLENGWL